MNPYTLSRLVNQLDCLPDVLGSATPEALRQRPASGKWSAQENLAHLLRHHEITMQRVQRILFENAPRLEPYNADEDSDWPSYAAVDTSDLIERLRVTRNRLTALLQELTPEQMSRIGVHSRMGEMALSSWLEFFLVHEGRHLYLTFLRARGA
jgi:hypothetical protein